MAKTKTTAELTAELESLKAQIDKIWALLKQRMDGDGRVSRAMAEADKG